MKVYSALGAIMVAAVLLTACDSDTTIIGIPSDSDIVTTSSQYYTFTSKSVALDSVMANSSYCYFGQVRDPETDTEIHAEFAAQFYSFENYKLPEASLILRDDDGNITADSTELRLYFTNYYGDATNPMKMNVYELDSENTLREDTTYYSDMDLSTFIPAGAEPIASKVFTATDYTITDTERSSSSYYSNVRVLLPKEYGTRIMMLSIDHPEYFLNSWSFIHHVCPGFYFKLQSGVGTMLTLDVSTLNVYFRYHDPSGTDSIYNGVSRFSATPEVIQSTSIQNEGIEQLLSNSDVPYTYLKTPAGIATELTLPVDEIFSGHEQDSISRARLILTRHNSDSHTGRELGTPKTLLMVHKPAFKSFFENRQKTNGYSSYTTSFESGYNTYTFTNIARMLSYLYHQKLEGMAKEGLTSEQWEARHPDWNRVIVTPVAVTSTTNQSTGVTSQVSVRHDFSLTSIRLVGGTKPLQMQVIYSHYK